MSDVIIIGGGPGGAAMGCYLSKAGISNTIIEQAIHPRPHVGESMVTASTLVFQDLDFMDKFHQAGFVKKFGAAWHPPTSKGEFDISFDEFPQEGIYIDYTYHVDRSKFDLMLLKHAEELGSKIYQGVRVKKVLFEGDQACGVQVRIGDQDVDLSAKLVVDASGRGTVLGRQLKLKKKDPIFNQSAVHAWFENVDRGENPETADYIHIYFLPVERGWSWQIPITDTITSMGVVMEKSVYRESNMSIEDFFQCHVESCPDLARAMRNAKPVNELKTEGDYSYSMERFVGNGFVMVGDAARFVDPIFSSGVSVALFSAKFASETIQHAFEIEDFSEATLQPYEEKLRGGVEIWYEFIRLYYKLMHVFTYFIQNKKHRLQVLRLLQGQVYDRRNAEVLDEMRNLIEAAENSEQHIFKKYLTAMPID
ncbi:MAG: NAD(P)/FAD-dependent oxidoreductase [Chloroflexota bacterium]